MNISFIPSFCHDSVLIFRRSLVQSLSLRQKTLVVLAIAAFSCLALTYFFLGKPSKKRKIKPLNNDQGRESAVTNLSEFLQDEPKRIASLLDEKQTLELKRQLEEAKIISQRVLDIVSVLIDNASEASLNGHREQAADFYQKALAIEPHHVLALLGLAQILYQQKNVKDALLIYQKVLEIDSKNLHALLNYAKILQGQNQLDKALATFEAVLDIEPANIFALIHAGLILHAHNRLEEASAKLEAALEIEPENLTVLQGCATILVEQKKLEKAGEVCQRALRIDSNDFEILSIYANALHLQGNLEGALAKLDEALKIRPEDAESLKLHAQILRQQGKTL